MPFVERDKDGSIVGVFENRQPGSAEEFFRDDAVDVTAFRDHVKAISENRIPRTNAEKLEKMFARAGLSPRDGKAELDKVAARG